MSSERVSAAFGVTCGGCRVGVLSTGAGASVPWKFWPDDDGGHRAVRERRIELGGQRLDVCVAEQIRRRFAPRPCERGCAVS